MSGEVKFKRNTTISKSFICFQHINREKITRFKGGFFFRYQNIL